MRSSNSNPIGSRTARERLAPRREPYWARLRVGLYLGYRRTEAGGHWIARLRGADGRQRFSALGTEYTEFDTAARAAFEWADRPTESDKPEAPAEVKSTAAPSVTTMTVSQACAAYVEYQKLHKSEKAAAEAATRFKRLVDRQAIGSYALSALTSVHIHSWIAAQVIGKEGEALRKAKDSANRQLASFKAALNFAYRTGLCVSDAAWRPCVPFRAVGRRRNGYVCVADRERLLNACAPDLRAFVTGLLLTAARPGELAGVRACDLDLEQGTVVLSGKTGTRTVALSSHALALFAGRAEFRIGKALLFTTLSGSRWTKERWGGALGCACSAAGLSGVVLYSIRHTAISEMIAGGLDAFTVARLAGTSTAMIDKHYGHLRIDRTRERLDSVDMLAALSQRQAA